MSLIKFRKIVYAIHGLTLLNKTLNLWKTVFKNCSMDQTEIINVSSLRKYKLLLYKSCVLKQNF